MPYAKQAPLTFSMIEKTSPNFVSSSTKKCREPRTGVRLQTVHSINTPAANHQTDASDTMGTTKPGYKRADFMSLVYVVKILFTIRMQE